MADATYRGRRSMLGVQYDSSKPSAASFGFGTAERAQISAKVFISNEMNSDKMGVGSPGPVYSVKGLDSRHVTAPSPSFGTSHRYSIAQQKRSASPVPGPGQYTLNPSVAKQADSQKHSYSSWKFGTSTRADQAKVYVSAEHAKSVTEFIDSPGPASYTHYGGVGNQSDSRKTSAANYGMGTAERFFDDASSVKGTPGPDQYALRSSQGRQVTSDKPSSAVPSFPRAEREKLATTVYMGPKMQGPFFGRTGPGPAVYTPQASIGLQASSTRPNAGRAGFGTADRFAYMNISARAMQSPGPGTYSV